MDDWRMIRAQEAEWRERNRGLLLALGACLAMWTIAIWWLLRP